MADLSAKNDVRKRRSWTDLFVDDFEMQMVPVSEDARCHLRGRTNWLWWYFLDFHLCYFVIGFFNVTFWRGSWDMAVLAFKKAFPVRIERHIDAI